VVVVETLNLNVGVNGALFIPVNGPLVGFIATSDPSGIVADVDDIQDDIFVIIKVGRNIMLPHRSQSPAPNEMLVKLVGDALLIEIAEAASTTLDTN
jgi:hypothetical protein